MTTYPLLLRALLGATIVFVGTQGLHSANTVVEGNAAYGDWRSDAPGVRRHIDVSDLPDPYASRSVANSPEIVERPADARLRVPLGFEVKLFANGLDQPRLMRVAPNGDVFVAESNAGRIRVLRPSDDGDHVSRSEIYASGLSLPFGIAFYPKETIPIGFTSRIPIPSCAFLTAVAISIRTKNRKSLCRHCPRVPGIGHATLCFRRTTQKCSFLSVLRPMPARRQAFYIASPRQWVPLLRRWVKKIVVGSSSEDETERADVLVFDPRGRDRRIYASGIRNCVGMAVNPGTGDLWCSTNERDGLGDNLPPDYITRIRENGFYGWPWYYIGAHQDPRHQGEHSELQDKIIVPDVLIQPHSASMQMMFYTGDQFPAEYKENIFAAEHGSWNRSAPIGYKIIRAIVRDHKITGEYEDFVTGFVLDDAHVWGRPVGVAEMKDGSLLFSEDANGTIWRVTAGSEPF